MDPLAVTAFSAYAATSTIIATQLSDFVSQPYMDEVFHIPQAQKYCNGSFSEVCTFHEPNIDSIRHYFFF